MQSFGMSSHFSHKRYEELAYKRLTGSITPEELAELSEWLNEDNGLPLEVDPSFATSRLEHENRIFKAISSQMDTSTTPVHFLKTKWLRYAAAIILILGVSGYLLFINSKQENKLVNNGQIKTDVLPGGNKATLTLANGTIIALDSAAIGTLAIQDGANVVKADNGQVEYKSAQATASNGTLSYNIINTPKGGEYQIKLPDGTNIWMNAASSIRFPTVFTDPERKVEVTGEIYFEVAKDVHKPFLVVAPRQEIKVLGTHFNINTYEDDGLITTTLLEGSVQIQSTVNNKSVVLKPLQQSTIAAGGQLEIIKNANTEEVLAWKNGLFSFHGAGIKQVMQQLARWYNVEVKYEGTIPQRNFGGKISRSYKLSEVLNVLRASDVHFTIVNNTIIIKNSP